QAERGLFRACRWPEDRGNMTGRLALLIDFGSTFTKLRAVDLDAARILGAGQGPSTVATDITLGLDAALGDLEARHGALPKFAHRLASSSAAGGLRMVTVGLVKELTAEAARQAALGAGAKLVGAFAYRLTAADMQSIIDLAPDMILLAGGTDGGNAEVILHNAGTLAEAGLDCPIVVAGNREAADEALSTLEAGGKPARKADNVMPTFGELSIEPARAAIRQIFIERIVHAKGIDKAADRLDAVLMPTPAAVMEGARLLSEGTKNRTGLGPLLVVDIGGATTDVHSVAEGAPSQSGVLVHGLPEPFVKRTVEGDLGVRHNAAAIVETVGAPELAAEARLDPEAVGAHLTRVTANVEQLPQTADDAAFDAALARAAVRVAVARHAGTIRVMQTVSGPVLVQSGKDLSNVTTVIGTGGPLAHGAAPASVLQAALADSAEPMSLRPKQPALYVDSDYLLYAAGLLADVDPDAGFALASSSLRPVEEEVDYEQRWHG
ncbi:MAG: methylaspartate mutase accessory protein GlmL, partial [Methyloligellaceae bacterium]